MDTETKINTLSVDLAIQRELAYREKIAELRLHQDADFIKKLLPLLPSSIPRTSFGQVQVPSSSPGPLANQNSTLIGSSSLVQLPSGQSSRLAPTPLKTPSSGLRQPQNRTPSSTVLSNTTHLPALANPKRRPIPAQFQFQRPMSIHGNSLQPSSIPRTSFGQVQVPSSSPGPFANQNSTLIGSSSLVQLPSSQSSRLAPTPLKTPSSGLGQPQNRTPSSTVLSNTTHLPALANPKKRPIPAQCQFQRPMSSPAPRQSEIGITRQARNSHLNSLPPRQPGIPRPSLSSCIIIDQVGNFFCKACQVPCTGALPLKQHLKGHKHKAKMTWLQLNNKDGGDKKDLTSCDLCQIWCTDEKTLELHLNGQKHMAKLQELEQGQQSSVKEKAREMPWCELCEIWCMNEDSFRQHLEGQKHTARLQRGPN